MWEEQSHRECSPEKDEYGLDKFKCNLANLHRPTQPDQPTGTDPRTITITTRQAATLIASGSGITRQPPGPKVIISMAFIVYTNPAPRYQTTTILGTPIEVEFTPTSYTWGWGDGTTTTTTDPGAPYPNQTVTHHYQHTATGVTTTLTTTWTTRYRPQGEATWRPIEGSITTTETSWGAWRAARLRRRAGGDLCGNGWTDWLHRPGRTTAGAPVEPVGWDHDDRLGVHGSAAAGRS